jgi:hypothetical protein
LFILIDGNQLLKRASRKFHQLAAHRPKPSLSNTIATVKVRSQRDDAKKEAEEDKQKNSN